MEIRFQLNTSEIRLDVIISKCQACGKSAPQRTLKKPRFCMEIQVASLLASVISKWEKLEFRFPPLMTERSKSNPPQQSAKLNSNKNKNSLTLWDESCKKQICIPNHPGAPFLLVFACCKQEVQELKIARERYFSIRTHWRRCAR